MKFGKITPVTSKTIKYSAINLTKDLQDAYTENYKTLLRESKEDLKKKLNHVHGLEDSIFYEIILRPN